MSNGSVVALCIAPEAGAPMQAVQEVQAIVGVGLEGDRYASAAGGSFNRKKPGSRQVTLINRIFFPGSEFTYLESRRNIVTDGIELMWLIGREFQIDQAILRGVKYCDPCERPNNLIRSPHSFRQNFFDRGGLVAEVLKGGLIRVNGQIIPPPRGY